MLVPVPKACAAADFAGRLSSLARLAALLVLANSGPLQAQNLYLDGPVPLLLLRPTSHLFLSTELEDETRISPFRQQKKDASTHRLKLDMKTRGFVYHPELVVFDAALRPEFKWQDEALRDDGQGNGSGLASDSHFLGYYLNTTWLREKPYTVELLASQDRVDISNSAALDSTTESSEYRGTLHLKSDVLPTTVYYRDLESTVENFFSTTTTDQTWHLESRNNTEKSRTRLKLEQRERSRQIADALTIGTNFSALLDNHFRFNSRRRLHTHMSFLESDFSGRDLMTAGFNSRLSVDHRRNFHSNYALGFSKVDTDDLSTETRTIGAGLGHQLYENLSSNLAISGLKAASDSGDLTVRRASLNFRYTRRIPWGRLDITLGRSERIEDDQRLAAFVDVQNESHTFEGASTTIILDNINVDVDSIVLTDAAGVTTFVPGIDYDVDVLGNAVIITRNILAGIDDDEAVLVSYRFAADPPAKTGVSGKSFGTTLYIGDKWRLFYRQSSFEERLIAGTPPDLPLDATTTAFGAELSLGWSTTRVEFNNFDSNRTPFKRRRFSETLRFRPLADLSLGMGAHWTRMEFVDTGEVNKQFTTDANLRWGVGGRGNLEARVFRREDKSSLHQQNQQGLVASYEWRYGAWRPRIRYQLLNVDNVLAEDARDRQVIYFEARRRFN